MSAFIFTVFCALVFKASVVAIVNTITFFTKSSVAEVVVAELTFEPFDAPIILCISSSRHAFTYTVFCALVWKAIFVAIVDIFTFFTKSSAAVVVVAELTFDAPRILCTRAFTYTVFCAVVFKASLVAIVEIFTFFTNSSVAEVVVTELTFDAPRVLSTQAFTYTVFYALGWKASLVAIVDIFTFLTKSNNAKF